MPSVLPVGQSFQCFLNLLMVNCFFSTEGTWVRLRSEIKARGTILLSKRASFFLFFFLSKTYKAFWKHYLINNNTPVDIMKELQGGGVWHTFIFTSLSKTDRCVEGGMWLPSDEGEVKDWTQGQATNSCTGCICRILHLL